MTGRVAGVGAYINAQWMARIKARALRRPRAIAIRVFVKTAYIHT